MLETIGQVCGVWGSHEWQVEMRHESGVCDKLNHQSYLFLEMEEPTVQFLFNFCGVRRMN